MAVFQTAVQYHLIHALALLMTALFLTRTAHAGLVLAGWFFTVGVLLFSGSLYALAITGIGILGAITPWGGVAFLLGWACLAWAAGSLSAS